MKATDPNTLLEWIVKRPHLLHSGKITISVFGAQKWAEKEVEMRVGDRTRV